MIVSGRHKSRKRSRDSPRKPLDASVSFWSCSVGRKSPSPARASIIDSSSTKKNKRKTQTCARELIFSFLERVALCLRLLWSSPSSRFLVWSLFCLSVREGEGNRRERQPCNRDVPLCYSGLPTNLLVLSALPQPTRAWKRCFLPHICIDLCRLRVCDLL